ncbi:MAG: hypothetical protein R2848_04075 [Thermomicrobiales bacterium]
MLAREVTALTHGEAAASEAAAAAAALFSSDSSIEARMADPNIPSVTLPAEEMPIAELFVRAGMTASRGEACRLAQQGGLSIDGVRVDDVDQPAPSEREAILLQVGKKRFKRVDFRAS